MRIIKFASMVIVLTISISNECYSASLLSYPWSSSGLIKDQGKSFTVYVHGKENSILLQPRLINTFNQDTSSWPISTWRHAAETFVSPIGCGISDVKAVSRMAASWEATYVCPEGIDLKSIARSERAWLLKGEPLRPIESGQQPPRQNDDSILTPKPPLPIGNAIIGSPKL